MLKQVEPGKFEADLWDEDWLVVMPLKGPVERFRLIWTWHSYLLLISEVLFMGFLRHDHSINPVDGLLREWEYDGSRQLEVSNNYHLPRQHRSLTACLQLRVIRILARY
jgi:hypothetical protein